jgi:thymidylate synthase (FAD)
MKVDMLFVTPEAEGLIEEAGRTSYLSLTKGGRHRSQEFIRMLIKRGHLSVLEHAYATFRISGVSRAFTHQLVRHRLCSFTQQSQRYVDESSFSYVEPESVSGNSEAHVVFTECMENTRKTYKQLQQLGIKNEDARFVLPNAIESQIVVTANLREWRHIIELRGDSEAQWEIRQVAIRILRMLKECVPAVFEDFKIQEENQLIRRNEI